MPATKPVTVLSSQPDIGLLERLTLVHRFCLAVVAVIAGAVLGGWLSPAIATLWPRSWRLMSAGTALAMLLAVASLALTGSGRRHWLRRLGMLLALSVFMIAGTALIDHGNRWHIAASSFLTSSPANPRGISMSLQTAIYLVLLGLTLLFIRARKTTGALIVDCFAVSMVIAVLIIFAGYCFNATQLFGQSPLIRTSPHTLLCMALLAFVAIGRRAESGYFAVLVGVGIGSQVSRIVLPVALVLPFVLTVASAYMRLSGWLTEPYARAMTAATMASVLCVLLVAMAWRINALERDLRDMSLTDALTGCYNRRGFGILSAQALRDARRLGVSVTALFFDVDDLKQVNDRLGHDAGSRILLDIGRLLRGTFRGADIVARVGGDEFAVVMQGDRQAADIAVARLDDKTRVVNRDGRRPYTIGYSVGMASSAGWDIESLDTLLTRADANMYEQKRARKAGRALPPEQPPEQPAHSLVNG